MANKHEKGLNILIFREMQIKATMEYLYTSIRTTKIEWRTIPSDAKNVELPYTADR